MKKIKLQTVSLVIGALAVLAILVAVFLLPKKEVTNINTATSTPSAVNTDKAKLAEEIRLKLEKLQAELKAKQAEEAKQAEQNNQTSDTGSSRPERPARPERPSRPSR